MSTEAPSAQTTPNDASPRPLVAIVGRPNVGKSSLFNRLAGSQAAITSAVAGTTRDRVISEVAYEDHRFLLVDTGGLVSDAGTSLEAQVVAQVDAAIAEADVIVMVADAPQGIMPDDLSAADRLRRAGKPVVLAGNKVDRPVQEALAQELHQLGLGDPIPISAYHRLGIGDLLEAIGGLLPAAKAQGPAPAGPHNAIVGRPNVGKSALANAILGQERSIVSETPGTTRDAVDTALEYDGHPAVLIDTAGIRRRGSVSPGVERYSVLRAVRAVDRCDVAVVVMDATELVTAQDLHITGLVMESFKGLVVAVNKCDLVPAERRDLEYARKGVLARLRFMDHVPVRFTSALQREGLDGLMRAAFHVYEQRQQWVPQEQLDVVVAQAVADHLPPKRGPRMMKIHRAKQEQVSPPTFIFFCNDPSLMHFSYERYLENVLRRAFGFQGTRLRLEFRGKGQVHVIGRHRTRSLRFG